MTGHADDAWGHVSEPNISLAPPSAALHEDFMSIFKDTGLDALAAEVGLIHDGSIAGLGAGLIDSPVKKLSTKSPMRPVPTAMNLGQQLGHHSVRLQMPLASPHRATSAFAQHADGHQHQYSPATHGNGTNTSDVLPRPPPHARRVKFEVREATIPVSTSAPGIRKLEGLPLLASTSSNVAVSLMPRGQNQPNGSPAGRGLAEPVDHLNNQTNQQQAQHLSQAQQQQLSYSHRSGLKTPSRSGNGLQTSTPFVQVEDTASASAIMALTSLPLPQSTDGGSSATIGHGQNNGGLHSAGIGSHTEGTNGTNVGGRKRKTLFPEDSPGRGEPIPKRRSTDMMRSVIAKQVKNTTANAKNKGLRHFSLRVCEQVESKGTTTYNDVADSLVKEFRLRATETRVHDDKNIRRRVYDALNVLMALDIIRRDKKVVTWVGFPSVSQLEGGSPPRPDRAAVVERVERKRSHLSELLVQAHAMQRLIEHNQETNGGVALDETSRIQTPFILVDTAPETAVACEMSEDLTDIHISLSNKFTLIDDTDVLRALGLAQSAVQDIIDSGTVPESILKSLPLYTDLHQQQQQQQSMITGSTMAGAKSEPRGSTGL